MNMTFSRPRLRVLLVGIAALALSGGTMAEPPSRAARLSDIGGTVSFSPAGQPDWMQAMVNLPLTTGDRLWADANSRAEVQVGGAAIRLGAATSVTLPRAEAVAVTALDRFGNASPPKALGLK